MAASTIVVTKVELIDTFPGVPTPGFIPGRNSAGELFSTDYHNTAKPVNAKVGQKASMYDPVYGWATFIYMQVGGLDGGTASAVGSMFGLEMVRTTFLATGRVTNDDDGSATNNVIIGGPGCMALSLMTTLYYGWFQCGGRPAITLIPNLEATTTFLTNGSVAEGAVQLGAQDADIPGLITGAITGLKIGFAYGADV